MGILGLTHDETGTALQRLPIAIKVAIGLGPNEKAGRKAPQKLDHFTFLRKNVVGQDVVWEPDADLVKKFGDKPTAVGIILLDDEPDTVFRTSYAWWTATECKCRGELVQVELNGQPKWTMQAVRRTEKHPEGEAWPGNYKYANSERKGQPVEGCGDGCPDLERGDCKPSGDLYFVLDKFPMFGAICRLHTTSYRSIRQISSALLQIRQITGGRLAGIRAMLKVRPEKGTYTDAQNKKHTTTLQILSLEIDAQDWQKLLANMTETSALFERTRRLLGGHRVEIVEDEIEKAPEISAEFHPAEIVDEVPAEVTRVQRIKDDGEPAPHAEAEPARPPKSTLAEEAAKYEAGNTPAPATLFDKKEDAKPAAARTNGHGKVITDKQVKRLWAVSHEIGWREAEVKDLVARYGFDSSAAITMDKYDQIISDLECGTAHD